MEVADDVQFCENDGCEHEVVWRVVTSDAPGGPKRMWLCNTCYTAFALGVKRGHYRSIDRLASWTNKGDADEFLMGMGPEETNSELYE